MREATRADIKIHLPGGGTLARPGAFKSEKRKKELMRQKKQEKKRQRRIGKDAAPGDVATEDVTSGDIETEDMTGEGETEEKDEPKGMEE